MSRIGKKPVVIPNGVTVEMEGSEISVKGPKGTLAMTKLHEVTYNHGDNVVTLKPTNETKSALSKWGMQRTLLSNLVEGVVKGYEKKLEITGVGYRAAVKGKTLNLQLGFSHDINFPIPEGIKIDCPDQTTVIVTGIDKQKVGQVAAKIREYRKPEPYKGKGVRYSGEYIFRKEGKKK